MLREVLADLSKQALQRFDKGLPLSAKIQRDIRFWKGKRILSEKLVIFYLKKVKTKSRSGKTTKVSFEPKILEERNLN